MQKQIKCFLSIPKIDVCDAVQKTQVKGPKVWEQIYRIGAGNFSVYIVNYCDISTNTSILHEPHPSSKATFKR